MPTATGASQPAEAASESKRLVAIVAPHLRLVVDGRPVRLALETARVSFPRGQGGLSTTRLDARFRAVGLELDGTPRTFELTNSYATDRVGWRELLVARGDGVAVRSSDASVDDRTQGADALPDRSAALAARHPVGDDRRGARLGRHRRAGDPGAR